jgi:FkbM family methyltransferase
MAQILDAMINGGIRVLKTLHLYDGWLSFKDKYRTKKMFLFYSRYIKKNDLCFDVGANIGNRVDIFLKLGGKVIAIEPQEACVQELLKKFKDNPDFTLIQKGLGEKEGEIQMMLSNAHITSSMSPEWIESVKKSGRFPEYKWDQKVTIQLTTLDLLIKKYGKPVFCKIDVEGFELQVLKGLSTPLDMISFEFTPEFIGSTTSSIKHLQAIGMKGFNYSVDESMRFVLPEWASAEEICAILENLPNKMIYGDVYAKSN